MCPQRVILIVAFMVFASAQLAGQDDVLAKAREAATNGRRAQALTILEGHLAEAPRDVDARLLYGLVLSWEGRYDDARSALAQVLEQAPGYTDARVALMNVEYWAGRSQAAREHADQILANDPGNAQARAVRERLAAAARPWRAGTSYTFDSFSDEGDAWHELALSLTRLTPVGPLIGRGSHATRFGLEDQLIEVEFYPRFRPGTYAFVGAGVAPDPILYPEKRFAFDLYQSVGRGVEVSGGARYLDFGAVTRIYVGTLNKYLGNWMLTGMVYRVAVEKDLGSNSYHGGFRRYFGGDGTSYVGVTYSHGFSREEIRNIGDLATLDSDTVRGEVDRLFRTRLRIFASGSTSRQERVNRPTRWQTTVIAGISAQF